MSQNEMLDYRDDGKFDTENKFEKARSRAKNRFKGVSQRR